MVNFPCLSASFIASKHTLKIDDVTSACNLSPTIAKSEYPLTWKRFSGSGKSLPRQWIFTLRNRWREITGGSHVINLERVFGRDKRGRKTRKVNHRALRELVKYATKAHDFSNLPKRILEFHRAFASVRRIQSFGSFLGCAKEIDEEKKETEQELIGCACGACRWKDGTPTGLFHITETEIRPDGYRQLRLFHDHIFRAHPPPELAIIPLEFPGQLDLFFTQTEIAF